MLFLISSGPYRSVARIVLGVILIVIGLFIKATNPHWLLIAAGILLLVVGIYSGLADLRKRRAGGSGSGSGSDGL
jgi:uncharacterized membrane protein HdeD (DUF308 family)